MKKIFILFCILVIATVMHGQNVQVTVQAPKVVGVGDQFEVEFSLPAQPSHYAFPNMTGFQVLGGPNTSSSTEIQMSNNQVIQKNIFSYSFVLQATNCLAQQSRYVKSRTARR